MDFFCRHVHPFMALMGQRGATYSELGKMGQFKPTDRVLEIGCGRWGFYKKLPKTESIIVTDADPWLAARCGKNKEAHATFMAADAHYLPFNPGTFDKVVSVGSFPDPPSEVYRVLKTGGLFIYARGSYGNTGSLLMDGVSPEFGSMLKVFGPAAVKIQDISSIYVCTKY